MQCGATLTGRLSLDSAVTQQPAPHALMLVAVWYRHHGPVTPGPPSEICRPH